MEKKKGESYVRFDKGPDVSSYGIESDDSTVRLICYIPFEVLSVFEDLKSVMKLEVWFMNRFGERETFITSTGISSMLLQCT